MPLYVVQTYSKVRGTLSVCRLLVLRMRWYRLSNVYIRIQLGAGLALKGELLGPILFFALFNIVRLAARYYGVVYGYKKGLDVVQDMSGGLLQKLTEGASILGLFIMGALVQKWTSINVPLVLSTIQKQDGTIEVTTVQSILDSLMPGLLPLLLTFACMWLLRNRVNAIWIILGFFVIGILGAATGALA